MKIITGTARGRRLAAPKDKLTRPTSAMVKEAMFSMIQFSIAGADVLDLFSGTGQLGLEALSRGAARCDFVDSAKSAVRLIEQNLQATKLAGGSIYQADAKAFLSRGTAYDIILLDPPYHFAKLPEVMQTIAQFDILRENGILMLETARDIDVPLLPSPYAIVQQNSYGNTTLTVYMHKVS